LDSGCRLKPLAPSGFAAVGSSYLHVLVACIAHCSLYLSDIALVFSCGGPQFGAVSASDSPRWFFRSDLVAARRLLSELVFV
ncbi:hypothetical protein U1Q18_038026, partial [Sarracenia purpurea var. burkii]